MSDTTPTAGEFAPTLAQPSETSADQTVADLARELAEARAHEARAQLAAAEQRLARWADAVEVQLLAALLEHGDESGRKLWDDVQAYRREQPTNGGAHG